MELFVNLNIYCYIFKLYNVFKFVILSISLLTLPNLIVGGGGLLSRGGLVFYHKSIDWGGDNK